MISEYGERPRLDIVAEVLHSTEDASELLVKCGVLELSLIKLAAEERQWLPLVSNSLL